MIKFFRKIRQRLLSENKISKYLVYAIGEVFLVVIGILIALQINNWNEEHNINKRQRNYLELVKTEMFNNLGALQIEKQKLKETLEGLREIISLSDKPTSGISEKELSSSWVKVFSKTIRFKYENGALTELISSGVLKEIKNDSIRNILAAWDGIIQKVLVAENEVDSYIQKGNDYLEKNGNVRVIIDDTGGNTWWKIGKLPEVKSNKFLLDSQEFENILVFASGTGQGLHDAHYEKVEQEIESLTNMIESELNKE